MKCLSSFRLLFPEDESLVDDLLWRANVNPKLRAHHLSIEDYDSLCQTFIEIADRHGFSRTPLLVNKPQSVVDHREGKINCFEDG